MTSAPKRDTLFPATSIGRSQGAKLVRSPSHESLTAHPLLSPTPSDTNVFSPGTTTTESPTTTNSPTATTNTTASTPSAPVPKYVPYTPRQRPAAATATVTVSSSSPTTTAAAAPTSSAPIPDATSKLQAMNMKAEAQAIGLDTGSVGWAMLEKLTTETEDWSDWAEIWGALTSSKAAILLPLEATSSALDKNKITADIVKDHIVFTDGASREDAPWVTMSGLRGTLEGDTFIVQSSLHPSSKASQDFLVPAIRAAALAALSPLPRSRIDNPCFTVPSHTTSLPLPPRPAHPNKPPLPPRPGARPSLGSTGSRLANPFASLFGHKPSSSVSSVASVPVTSSPTASPAASVHTLENDHSITISAFTIDRPIIFKDVGRELLLSIRNDVKNSLAAVGARTWVIDRVQDFTSSLLHPLVKEPKAKGQSKEEEKRANRRMYAVSAASTDDPIEEIADIVQDFYDALEQDLRSLTARKSGSGPSTIGVADDASITGDSSGTHTPLLSQVDELKTREIIDCVETTICEVFYDRLFMPPTSDDSHHDDALASMIAALNQLDLTLAHLDLDIPKGMDQRVEEVILACGSKLAELEDAHSPIKKSSIILAAHKVLVDGLSKLPPIKFKAEEAPAAAPEPNDPLRGEQEMISVPTIVEPTGTNDAGTEAADALYPDPPPESPAAELPTEPTPVSGDILLPFLIFSVVKSNPPHLVSSILFTQRFRNHKVGGEENYALINATAVVEFLEHVDVSRLGLGDNTQVVSAAALAPIPIARSPAMSEHSFAADVDGGLSRRMGQGVDAIAGSANKVLTGVVDTSFGMLRSFLPSSSSTITAAAAPGSDVSQSSPRPGFGLLRRESGFSIAGISIGGPGGLVGKSADDGEKELATVSRPGSVRSKKRSEYGGSEYGVSSAGEEESEDSDEEEEEDEEDGEEDTLAVGSAVDTRSIRSFENMMSARRPKKKKAKTLPRLTLGDRLATMSGLKVGRTDTPNSLSPVTSPALDNLRLNLPPPNKRFMESAGAGDLKLSEIPQLLAEYKRLVEAVKNAGGYDE